MPLSDERVELLRTIYTDGATISSVWACQHVNEALDALAESQARVRALEAALRKAVALLSVEFEGKFEVDGIQAGDCREVLGSTAGAGEAGQ